MVSKLARASCERHHWLPWEADRIVLTVVSTDPENRFCMDDIKKAFPYGRVVFRCTTRPRVRANAGAILWRGNVSEADGWCSRWLVIHVAGEVLRFGLTERGGNDNMGGGKQFTNLVWRQR